MDKTSRLVGGAFALVLIGGCAKIPAQKQKYYDPITSINVKVERTIGCDEKKHIFIANDVEVIEVNRADTSKDPHVFDTEAVSGTFSDSTVGLKRSPDMRLISVNMTNTGQGGPILKTLGSLFVAAFVGLDESKPRPTEAETIFASECEIINNEDKGKPVTLTYGITVIPSAPEASPHSETRVTQEPLHPAVSSVYLDSKLNQAIGTVVVSITTPKYAAVAPVSVGPGVCSKDDECIQAVQPALAKIQVYTKDGNVYAGGQSPLAEDSVLIAQLGVPYVIPVMKPAAFGKGTLQAEFDSSGALTNIEYGSETGAVGLIGAIDTAVSQRNGELAAGTKAINDKSDRVAANNRWVICHTTPKDCK